MKTQASLAEISVSNLYQNWIKMVSKLCLIQFWYSFSVSNLYQKLFDIILIVSNLYQNCIKCVSEVWYNLILSNWYQNCIKSDFVTFDSIKTVSNQTLSSFDSIKTVSNHTLSFLTLSNLYQIRLCHFWLYQNCIKSNFVTFWLNQNCIKSHFISYLTIKSVSNQTLSFLPIKPVSKLYQIELCIFNTMVIVSKLYQIITLWCECAHGLCIIGEAGLLLKIWIWICQLCVDIELAGITTWLISIYTTSWNFWAILC